MISSRRGVRLVWWATCLIWSGVWLSITIGVSEVPPLSLASFRLVIAIAVLAPFVLSRPHAWPRRPREFALIAVTGILLLGVNYGLVFWAARRIPSGLNGAARHDARVWFDLRTLSFERRALLVRRCGSHALGEELYKKNIAAVAVTPGYMRTGMVLKHNKVTERNWTPITSAEAAAPQPKAPTLGVA